MAKARLLTADLVAVTDYIEMDIVKRGQAKSATFKIPEHLSFAELFPATGLGIIEFKNGPKEKVTLVKEVEPGVALLAFSGSR